MLFNYFKSAAESEEIYQLELFAIQLTTNINPLIECILKDESFLAEHPYRSEFLMKHFRVAEELIDIAFERKKSSIAQVKRIEKKYLEVLYGVNFIDYNISLGTVLVDFILENQNDPSFHRDYLTAHGAELEKIKQFSVSKPLRYRHAGDGESTLLVLWFVEEFLYGKTITNITKYFPPSWLKEKL